VRRRRAGRTFWSLEGEARVGVVMAPGRQIMIDKAGSVRSYVPEQLPELEG